ncbi:MAG: hypothetical protein AAGB97_02475 [Dehalococcoidia bacterium]
MLPEGVIEYRQRIALCHRIGLELEEFMGLDAMKRIAGEVCDPDGWSGSTRQTGAP